MKKLLFFAMTALCMLACNTNNPDIPNGSNNSNGSIVSAKITTDDVTDVLPSSATLQGSLGVDITDYSSAEFGFVLSDNADAVNNHKGQFYKAKAAMYNNFNVSVKILSPDTKYYYCAYLLLNDIQYEFGTVKTFQTQAPIDGVIYAAFSVGKDKYVNFSTGNLQYQASTDTWRFAEHQYDMMGEDNENISSSYSGWIDLFCWGTGNNPFKTYNSTFTDWGVNPISNGGNKANQWRTLTYDEWKYLLEKRPDAEGRSDEVWVNGVRGLILLPDSWTLSSNPIYNSYFVSEWAKMEAAGALFLPAAGSRNGTDLYGVGDYGEYWSATPYNEGYAYFLSFSPYGGLYASMEDSRRSSGLSVRLVQDLP